MELNIFLSLLILSSVGGFSSIRNPTCGIALDVPSFVYLEQFCEDCFNLYREEELHHLCQADCYDNDIFFTCLKALKVNQEARDEAYKIIGSLKKPGEPFSEPNIQPHS